MDFFVSVSIGIVVVSILVIMITCILGLGKFINSNTANNILRVCVGSVGVGVVAFIVAIMNIRGY